MAFISTHTYYTQIEALKELQSFIQIELRQERGGPRRVLARLRRGLPSLRGHAEAAANDAGAASTGLGPECAANYGKRRGCVTDLYVMAWQILIL